MNTVQHSGHTFESLGRTRFGDQIWPIKEYLVRAGHSRSVAERIERLNPNGKAEGEWPRGWHPHQRAHSYLNDCVSVRDFCAKFGSAAYRAIPKGGLIRQGHRKAVSRLYVTQIACAK